MATNTAILAISPGTRYIGIAFFRDGILYDWKVRSYKGIWSEDKLQKMMQYLEWLVITRVIYHIACKVPHESRSSVGIKDIVEGLKSIAEEYKISFSTYTIADLKKGGLRNKKELSRYAADRHPELLHQLRKESVNRNPYYTRMFEAIATGMLCHKERCQK